MSTNRHLERICIVFVILALIVAALLAIVLPRYLERAWRCKLNTARIAMIVAMAIGLAILFVVIGLRHGFNLRAPQ